MLVYGPDVKVGVAQSVLQGLVCQGGDREGCMQPGQQFWRKASVPQDALLDMLRKILCWDLHRMQPSHGNDGQWRLLLMQQLVHLK